MSKFKVIPANGGQPYDVEADRLEFDPISHRHTLLTGDGGIVASLINVSIVKLPDEPPAAKQAFTNQ